MWLGNDYKYRQNKGEKRKKNLNQGKITVGKSMEGELKDKQSKTAYHNLIVLKNTFYF